MTFLFDWISLLFMGVVFIISFLVILYRDDYISGDLNIVRFIMLVLIFVVSMMFLIVSPNIISRDGHASVDDMAHGVLDS
jgi:NADH-ubiquinone oxidoreductase chain 5